MRGLFSKLPIFVLLMAFFALIMLIPAAHAAIIQDLYVARVFFYSGLLLGFLTLFVAISMAGQPAANYARRHLLGLLAIFAILPAILAFPLQQALGNTSFLNAYVEMVSSLTTTGATVFDDPDRLPPSVHLWRALVGWVGGLILWVGAVAILAPMALGGFELRAGFGFSEADLDSAERRENQKLGGKQPSGSDTSPALSQITGIADISERLRIYAAQLAPIYAGLTLILWVGLIMAGDTAFVGFCHALATMSTSGISPIGGLPAGNAGWAGEGLVAIFLIFAVSRLAFSAEGRLPARGGEIRHFLYDPEVRVAGFLILAVTVFLFARHWLGAFDVAEERDVFAGLRALWGAAFTALSFLTTTGFISAEWSGAQDWSGLHTPGLILMGLALIGGGVATTAGGAKLLRVYALYKHAGREMAKLVHPSSVGGAGREARHLRSRGAYLAWVFLMLMVVSVAVFMLAFSLTGEGFETAMVLTISALTTTGPLAEFAAAAPISYGALSTQAKLILSAAMVMGRLETLAIIALINPDIWRR